MTQEFTKLVTEEEFLAWSRDKEYDVAEAQASKWVRNWYELVSRTETSEMALFSPDTTNRRGPFTPWWLVREALRIIEGVYTVSPVLERLNNTGMYTHALHVSITDPTLVGFTDSPSMGEADRQTRMTLGRYLSKYYPLLSAQEVDRVQSLNSAYVNTQLEFITGEDIVRAYREEMASGVGACMSKTTWSFEQHPTQAYDAPAVKLAVIRDGAGKIQARSLVAEKADGYKVYIRTYGARELIRAILEREGYKKGDFTGVWLKAAIVGETGSEVRLAFPYLDQCDTIASSESNRIALIGDRVRVLTASERDVLARLDPKYIGSANAEGRVTLKRSPADVFTKTCVITGQQFDTLSGESPRFLDVWYQGQKALAQASAVPANWVAVGTRKGALYTDPSNLVDTPAGRILNAPDELEYCSVVELSHSHYPAGTYERLQDSAILADGSRIRKTDSYYLATSLSDYELRHKDAPAAGKTFVCLQYLGRPVKALKDAFVLLPSGRKAHPILHKLVQCWDGSWCKSADTVSTQLFGKVVYARSHGHLEEFRSSEAHEEELLRNAVTSLESSSLLSYLFSNRELYTVDVSSVYPNGGNAEFIDMLTSEEWRVSDDLTRVRASLLYLYETSITRKVLQGLLDDVAALGLTVRLGAPNPGVYEAVKALRTSRKQQAQQVEPEVPEAEAAQSEPVTTSEVQVVPAPDVQVTVVNVEAMSPPLPETV